MNCDDLTVAEEIAAELALVDLTGFLVEDGVVQRYSVVRDGTGGRTEVWTPQSRHILCNIKDVTPVEQKAFGEVFSNERITQQLKTERSVILNVRDRVVVGTHTYEVMGVMNKSTFAFFNLYFCIVVA